MSTGTVHITVRKVYGVEKAYPACETSNLFAKIAGTKTLSLDVIDHIIRLGYRIEAKTSSYSELITEINRRI